MDELIEFVGAEGRMRVFRKVEIDTDVFRVGDQIRVGHYTATCQKVIKKGYLMLLDQYLDEVMQMVEDEDEDDYEYGYTASDFCKRLNSEEILTDFSELRDRMIPFRDGNLLRIPFSGEIFGHGLYSPKDVKPDGYEQWALMKDKKNRIAFHKNGHEWGWLQNEWNGCDGYFCLVDSNGNAIIRKATHTFGVRPVFQLVKKVDK